jgi:sugar/nucleoside kinase (ribokinase family)
MARADWWSGNEAEACRETGLTDPAEAGRMLASASSRPGGGVVVRLGEAGCLVVLRDASVERAVPVERAVSVEHVGAFPVRAVDTNGAGDAHIGAFLAALSQGAPPASAARRANAAAALAVSRRGPATAPTAIEVDALLAAYPLN